jgi:predicted nucleic acid-binding protein
LSAGFVADASVGFAWVHPGQATPETDRLLQEVAAGAPVAVPSLWFLEMANVTLMAERRRRLTAAQRKTALEQLAALQFTVDEEAARMAFVKISQLAIKHGLTIYDATYLELALRRKMALATRDKALRKAGLSCGLAVVG